MVASLTVCKYSSYEKGRSSWPDYSLHFIRKTGPLLKPAQWALPLSPNHTIPSEISFTITAGQGGVP
jgi:hypothetical protein